MAMNDDDLAKAYKELDLHGRDIAEIEIEARRDAHELRSNPYKSGTFAAMVFEHERLKIFVTETGVKL